MNRLDFLKSAGAILTSALLNSFPKLSFSNMEQLTADAVIVGGNYAGLSAAMTLGRALRRVVIIGSGLPCNRQTPHSHNLITLDGATPARITAAAKAQVLAYSTVSFQNGTVVSVTGTANAFVVRTAAPDCAPRVEVHLSGPRLLARSTSSLAPIFLQVRAVGAGVGIRLSSLLCGIRFLTGPALQRQRRRLSPAIDYPCWW